MISDCFRAASPTLPPMKPQHALLMIMAGWLAGAASSWFGFLILVIFTL
jgi:hypothetical protein